MAKRIIDARVRQKAAPLEEWNNSDLDSLDGEQLFVRSDVDDTVIGFKLGTKNKKFSELPYPDFTVRGKVSTTSTWTGRQSGIYIPTTNGNYNGVSVNLTEGYQVLYWDGSTIEKVVYPNDYVGAVFGGVIDDTYDLSSPTEPIWYIASTGTYNTAPPITLTENSILTWNGQSWSHIPFELEVRGEFLVADNIQEVRNITPEVASLLVNETYKGVTVLGYYEPNDTPGPINYYLSDTLDPDDGGSVIVAGGIKLEHKFSQFLSVKYFGAKCDGFSDYSGGILTGTIDTDAWKRCLTYAKNNDCKNLTFDGISRTDETLLIDFSGLVISGDNVETSRIIKSGNHKTSGLGIIDGDNYDDIDAVFLTVGYQGDFVFRQCKIESRDNSDYAIFMPKIYRPYFCDIYAWGAKENIRMYQVWNANFFKVRTQGIPLTGAETPTTNYGIRIEGYPRLPDGSPNLSNPYQSTSVNLDNCYAERVDFGFKFVNIAYFSGNSLSADSNFECCYWFDYCVGAFNGVGTEKSRGQLIRNWRSNMVINGHQVLEIRNYTGTPVEAKSKAKIEVWTQGRANTGLILNSSNFRGYSAPYKTGNADWLYVGTDTFCKFSNWNHTVILADNINGRTLDGVFERDNVDGYDRTQGTKPYAMNGVDMLPSYSYAYNQKRVILKPEKIVSINTMSTDSALTSVSIPIADIIKVFPDFTQTDGFIRDFFQFKIKSSGSLSITPFSYTTVETNNVYKIGTIAGLASVTFDSTNVVFNFESAINRPVITIERLKQGYPRGANTVFKGVVGQGVHVPDGSSIDTLLASLRAAGIIASS